MTMAGSLGFGGSIGDAYAELHFTTSTADADLRKSLDKASKEGDKAAETIGKKFGKTVIDEMSTEMEKNGGKAFTDVFEKTISKQKVKVKTDVDVDVDRDSLRRATGKISRALTSALSAARKGLGFGSGDESGPLGGILGALGGPIKSLGASVGNVGSEGPFAGGVGALILLGIPALVGAVGALLNVLAPLVNTLFFLPAALSTVAAAIIPVIVGFHGFGDALKIIMNSDDPEELDKAFKSISKSAGLVAVEIKNVMPQLQELHKVAQESLFAGLVGTVPRLVNSLIPTLLQGLAMVNTSFGHFVDNLVKVFENPRMERFLSQSFLSAAILFEVLGPSLNKFLLALADVGTFTLPAFENFIIHIFALLDRFSGWLTEITQNGQLAIFIEELITAAGELKELAASGWSLIKVIVGDTGEDNRASDFMDNLNFTIDKLTEFFESDIGKQSILGMVFVAEVLLAVLGSIVVVWAATFVAIEAVGAAMGWLVGKAVELSTAIRNATGEAYNFLGVFGLAGTAVQLAGLLPKKAEGDIFTSPQAVIVGEAGPEVLLPLGDPARARELANQSGLNSILGSGSNGGGIIFGPGAIQINFNGQLPTQQQAYGVGQSVADGISSVLTRRDTRLAVRAM